MGTRPASACQLDGRDHRGTKWGRGTRTAELNVIVVLGSVDGLDVSADVEVLDRVVEVVDGRVRAVIGAKDLLGLVRLVRLVDRRNCAASHWSVRAPVLLNANKGRSSLVRMASGDSSRESRRVTRVPSASLSESTCSCETSRVMGIGNRAPSARRSVSTTLRGRATKGACGSAVRSKGAHSQGGKRSEEGRRTSRSPSGP